MLGLKKMSLFKKKENEDPFAKVKSEKEAAVISIEMTYPRTFGLDQAGSSSATGFVVDKVKGIILTNKHVVQEGPVRAKARFLKHEELDLTPIYRDPVHDFGFFTFNPKELVETPSVEIELDPAGATRGRNTLIIGNNGGERLSFVETTVARTDRPYVPMLDLNTFYITASDTGVGGSSGAPMLTTEGKAVAMVAAGNDGTNISMYLPLYRVARALEFIKAGEEITRGTLQIGFKHKTFEALQKRGAITEQLPQVVREKFKDAEGLLVVEKNLPKGPGREAGIKNGDVLLRLNGNIVHNFVQLEEVLDTFVDKQISLVILREMEQIELKATVQNLREITNTRFVEVSNGIFHNIQYMVAMYMNLPIEGIFLAQKGYMFRRVPFAAIIKKIGKVETQTLDDFIAAVKDLPNGKLVSVKFQPINDPNKLQIETVVVDKRWYPFQVATRDDVQGKWDYDLLLDEAVFKKKSLPIDDVNINMQTGLSTSEHDQLTVAENARTSLLKVEVSFPFSVDGNYSFVSNCCGIVVDKQLGLVLADREAVNTTLCDVQLTFNASKTIPAKAIFIHPQLPFSFIKYDPDLLKEEKTFTVSDVKLSDTRPEVGDKLNFVGLTSSFEFDQAEVKVTNFRDVDPFGGDLDGHANPPSPTEIVSFSQTTSFGVFLCRETNAAKALSLSSMLMGKGTIACDILPLLTQIQEAVINGTMLPPTVKLLPITTSFIPLSEARNIHDLSEEWSRKLTESMTIFQQKLITVRRRMVTTDAHDKLLENDIILSVNDEPVTLIKKFYNIVEGQDSVKLQVLREGQELSLDVKTNPFSTLGTTRIIHFGGLILQESHSAIYYLSKPEIMEEGGVYVSFQEDGSPAQSSEAQNEDLTSTTGLVGKLIVKIGGASVKTLDDVVANIKLKKHNEFVRLVAKNIRHGEESVHDVRLDLEFWKSRDMYLDENQDWISHVIDHNK